MYNDVFSQPVQTYGYYDAFDGTVYLPPTTPPVDPDPEEQVFYGGLMTEAGEVLLFESGEYWMLE